VSDNPRFGYTRDGAAVHDKVLSHHPDGTLYERFNKAVALWLTKNVGTMTCYWVFTVIALLSLPATLKLADILKGNWVFPAFAMTLGFIYFVQWVAQSYLQLVLLPALMVGQNLQNAAADVRSAKQFEDTELIVDRLDVDTEGGLTEVLNAVNSLRQQLISQKGTT
jgi:hypothetical protein